MTLRRLGRSKVAASVGLLIFLNVPIVYLSVKWWRSLHQVQSTPNTMDPAMATVLRTNALALLAVAILFLFIRMRLAKREELLEDREAVPPGTSA